MLSSIRQGGLRYVAVQSGKSCQGSARKSRAASKHASVHWRWGEQGGSWLMGSILSMENGRGAAGSLRQVVWRNSLFPAATRLYDSFNQLFTTAFYLFFYICFRSFTEQTWNFMSLFVIFNMCIDFPSSKLCWANIRLLPRWIKIMGNRSLPIKLPFNFNNIDLTRKRNAWRNISSRTGFPC